MLQEDREALRNLQKHQPRFTDDQKKELSQVHPWIRTGRLPRAINIPVSSAGPNAEFSPQPAEKKCKQISFNFLKNLIYFYFFQGCTGCKCPPSVPPATPFDVEIHEMELCTVLKAQEDCTYPAEGNLSEATMADVQPDDEDEEEDALKKTTQNDGGDTTAGKRSPASETVEEKAETWILEEKTHLPGLWACGSDVRKMSSAGDVQVQNMFLLHKKTLSFREWISSFFLRLYIY